MILKILYTILLSISLGKQAQQPTIKNRTIPNRSIVNHNWSETIQLQEQKYYNKQDLENTDFFNVIQVDYNHVENSYIKADIMVATTNMDKYGPPPYRAPLGNIAGISNNKLGHEEYKITISDIEYKYHVMQKIYYVKIDAINTNVETKININEEINLKTNESVENEYNYQNVEKYIYQRTYTNTNKNLDRYYPVLNTQTGQYEFNNINLIYRNNNLYDAMQEIIYSTGGYTGTITEDSYLIEDNYTIDADYNRQDFNIERDKDLYIKPNNTNYYIIYEEVKYITASTININDPIKYMMGYSAFYSTPYTEITLSGVNVVNSNNVEVVNIPGVMFDVLGMPFTFVSTAFNLTIFPGTPYELNISTLFLSIIAVLVFVFLIKIILNAVGKQ